MANIPVTTVSFSKQRPKQKLTSSVSPSRKRPRVDCASKRQVEDDRDSESVEECGEVEVEESGGESSEAGPSTRTRSTKRKPRADSEMDKGKAKDDAPTSTPNARKGEGPEKKTSTNLITEETNAVSMQSSQISD